MSVLFRSLSTAFVLILVGGQLAAQQPQSRPDVLMVAIDDLNDWTGLLGGHPQAATPNLDRLMRMGVRFSNAHCAAPACNPSRAALMSVIRPHQSGVYDNGQDWKPVIPQSKTLTKQFLDAGYEVLGAGKIYHSNVHRDGEWSEYFVDRGTKLIPHASANGDGVGGIKFYPIEGGDDAVSDHAIASYAIEQLNREHDRPLFLAVGFHKPHMPWAVPKEYFDRFPLEQIQLPQVLSDDLADVPSAGSAMAKPEGDHAKMLASGRWKEAVQGYLATIAYMDGQLGRVLDAYERPEVADRTILVLWSDHGWHLGEKEHWRKFALWEESTRVPYAWVVPGTTGRDIVCDRPVDLMSIYPTLCELCGVEKPAHGAGESLVPLLHDPASNWNAVAMTTFHRGNHSVRDDRYRYIRYADGGEELYDLLSDPHCFDNLAGDSQLGEIKRALSSRLPQEEAAELPRQESRPARQRRANRRN